MKKIILFILSAIILAGCSAEPSNEVDFSALTERYSADVMQIVPSKFSDETTAVMSLFDSDIKFFDFKVDDTVNSVRYNLWVYDGEWKDSGGSYGDIESTSEMLALVMQDDGFELMNIDENGHTSISYPSFGIDYSDMSMTVSGWLENPTDIVPNSEILLYHKYGTNANSIATNDENFREVECEVGVAVTVTFSGDTVD